MYFLWAEIFVLIRAVSWGWSLTAIQPIEYVQQKYGHDFAAVSIPLYCTVVVNELHSFLLIVSNGGKPFL